MTTSGTVPENLQVLFAALDATRAEREELYTWFHQHPELSMQEEHTAARVKEELRAYGCEVLSLAGTGRVGILRNGDGPTVLFRADMDALPIAEDSGLEYAVAKERGLMHACGHDFHTACLLGATRAYAAHPEAWSGTLIALFQPGEEAGGGAQKMVDDGLADKIPQPDVALAQHVGPFAPDYAMTTRPGALMAEATNWKITVYGRGGHGSQPHLSTDAVVLAANIITRLQTVIAREFGPQQMGILTVGSVHAGASSNSIAESAQLGINTRAMSPEATEQIVVALKRIVRALLLLVLGRFPGHGGSPRQPLPGVQPGATADPGYRHPLRHRRHRHLARPGAGLARRFLAPSAGDGRQRRARRAGRTAPGSRHRQPPQRWRGRSRPPRRAG